MEDLIKTYIFILSQFNDAFCVISAFLLLVSIDYICIININVLYFKLYFLNVLFEEICLHFISYRFHMLIFLAQKS